MSTIMRGAAVLKELKRGTHQLSEISRQLHLSKSCTHRVLESLRQVGLVMQNDMTSRYYIGPLVFQLAEDPLLMHGNLIEPALEELKHLNRVTNETVALFVPFGTQRLCLEELPSGESLKFAGGKLYTAPIHLGSPGKMLLSQLANTELDKLLDKIASSSVASSGLNRQVLKREVARIRRTGYAVSFGQRVPGSASISVSIKHHMTPVALTIVGPKDRIRAKRKSVLKDMMNVARHISDRLQRQCHRH